MRIATVNVVESFGGEIKQIVAFANTPEGNQLAQRLFKTLILEYLDPDFEVDKNEYHGPPLTEFELNNIAERGVFNYDDYSLAIVNSETQKGTEDEPPKVCEIII